MRVTEISFRFDRGFETLPDANEQLPQQLPEQLPEQLPQQLP